MRPPFSAPSGILVIGYGNELRGDDAAGPRVAEAVDAWNRDDTRVVVSHQLLPELAEDVATARVVFFVDASLEVDDVVMERLEPRGTAVMLPHTGEPGAILDLAQVVYGQVPGEAWLVHVPVEQFDLAAPLSERTRQGVEGAVAAIRARLDEEEGTCTRSR